MELVIKAYGKLMLEGLAVMLLVVLLFGQIEDADGNRGILRIIGAHLGTEQTGTVEYADFQAYQSEGKKCAPIISYTASSVLYTGTYNLADCITAVDDAGATLQVGLLGMWNPFGEELDVTEQAEVGQMVFEYPGIYTAKVAAVDAGNKKTVCLIQIPVNK
ncbi:MAG: hypothetical protein J6C37_02715 [Roseburia sp.]|nr:hypothetical protein [Roseburia sp.]